MGCFILIDVLIRPWSSEGINSIPAQFGASPQFLELLVNGAVDTLAHMFAFQRWRESNLELRWNITFNADGRAT